MDILYLFLKKSLDLCLFPLSHCVLRDCIQIAPLAGQHHSLEEAGQITAEVLVDLKFLRAGKLLGPGRGKHHSCSQILPPVLHCYDAAVLDIRVLVKAVLHLCHRDALLLDLHYRVGTSFKEEPAVRKNLNQVGGLKPGRIAYVWGADNQASLCVLGNLCIVEWSPLKAVLGLPVCNA